MRLISISGLLFFFISGQPSLKKSFARGEIKKVRFSSIREKRKKEKSILPRQRINNTGSLDNCPLPNRQRESSRESNKEEESAKESGGQVIRFRSNEKRELDLNNRV